MATATKSKGLTKSEKYQFDLTGSNAQTIAAQRAAISRAAALRISRATAI